MGRDLPRPYSRRAYARALALNAATDPFNVGVAALVLVAGILLGVLPILGPVAALIYALAFGRTFLDDDEAQRVLARERRERDDRRPARVGVEPALLAPPVRARVLAARERESRIGGTLARGDLPPGEVAGEVQAFVAAVERTAQRAQLLFEALADSPPREVERRLNGLDAGRSELRSALASQLAVLKRMEVQLRRFYDEMDRVNVELDTIRAGLVSMSATTESDLQRRVADDVRALRDEIGAVSEGLAQAYERGSPP